MKKNKKELIIDLSWVNPKNSGGGYYASKNIIDCILKNKNIFNLFEITIIARKEYLIYNKFSNKVKQIKLTNNYILNFLIRFFILIFLEKKQTKQLYFCPNLYVPLFKRNFKIINLIYDNQWKYFPQYFSFLRRQWIKFNLFIIDKNSDHVICESHFIKNQFLNLKKKIKVIYIPFKKKKNKIMNKKNRFKFFFILSSLLPHKNTKMIEDIFMNNVIKSKVKNLIIAGIGGKNKILKNKEKKIIYIGKISENKKEELYKNCYAYLFPSLYEGFGMTIVEALQFKKKIICSDLDVLRETGGSFPYFVKKKLSKKEWIKAIENIGRKKINKVKINYFLKRYDEDNISQQYLNLFKNI